MYYVVESLRLQAGKPSRCVLCNQPPRSTQPSIPPGSVNRVPACMVWVRRGAFTCFGWQVALWSHMASDSHVALGWGSLQEELYRPLPAFAMMITGDWTSRGNQLAHVFPVKWLLKWCLFVHVEHLDQARCCWVYRGSHSQAWYRRHSLPCASNCCTVPPTSRHTSRSGGISVWLLSSSSSLSIYHHHH